MAEQSGYWTTSATPSGHQVASYSQVNAAVATAIIAACNGFEGVAAGFLNQLAGSVPGANTARIATGGAIVDGQWYKNGANVDVTIPSAVGGGNTRIDRIVLRCTWANFEVEITRIAGTDAASPTAPAITQTPGTTYDIMLYQALVNTSGTVTLTDERVWAITGQLVDDVTIEADPIVGLQLKDDGIDDTKIGNRVPYLNGRRGGSATNWATGGTNVYTPDGVRLQAGSLAISLSAAAFGSGSVTFPTAFAYTPLVMLTIMDNVDTGEVAVSSSGMLTTGFDFAWRTVDGSTRTALTLHWLAIGPDA